MKNVRFIPGEHDAALDNGRAFKEFFGPTNYTFEHKGVHFIVLDNVSDPAARLGDEQLVPRVEARQQRRRATGSIYVGHRRACEFQKH